MWFHPGFQEGIHKWNQKRIQSRCSKVLKGTKDAQKNIVSIFENDEHLCERTQVCNRHFRFRGVLQ